MRQRIIMTLAALVCFAMGYAGNISVESISLKPGETKDLKVSLTSAVNEMVGVQFDVTLPEGFSLENSSDDKVYQLSTNQASDLACTVSNLGSGTYRFVLYSNSLKKLKEGELISLNLKASSTMALANYSISISNVAFSDDDGHVTKESGVNVTVKVTDFFTLLYQVDGADYKSYEVEYGAAITAEDNPNKEGYTFSGWSEIPETMPAHDVTVTGTFSINKYKLTYMVDGEEYKTCEIEYGATITAESEPTKEGYTFSGWSEIPRTMPAKDVVVTGSFTVNSYTVTFMYGNEVLHTEKVNYGAPIPLPNISDKYGFVYKWLDVPETMPAHDVVLQVDETDVIFGIADENLTKEYYLPNGQRVARPQKGLNIIRMSNGTSRRMLVR